MRRAFGMTLIALLLAAMGYMFYETIPMMVDLFATASPGERVQMSIVMALCAVILVCRVTVAVLSHLEKRAMRQQVGSSAVGISQCCRCCQETR